MATEDKANNPSTNNQTLIQPSSSTESTKSSTHIATAFNAMSSTTNPKSNDSINIQPPTHSMHEKPSNNTFLQSNQETISQSTSNNKSPSNPLEIPTKHQSHPLDPDNMDKSSNNGYHSDWSCSICTFMNEYHHSRCSMCEAPKPSSSSSLHGMHEDTKTDECDIDWSCSRCTLINKSYNNQCDACNLSRYQRKSPTPPNCSSLEIPSEYTRYGQYEYNEMREEPLREDISSNPPSLEPIAADTNDDDNDSWYDMDDDTNQRQINYKDPRVWKRKNVAIKDQRDWKCIECGYYNDYTITRQHDVPCCLKCGVPNEQIPELEMKQINRNNINNKRKWECIQCHKWNKDKFPVCCKCHGDKPDGMDQDDDDYTNDVEERSYFQRVHDEMHGISVTKNGEMIPFKAMDIDGEYKGNNKNLEEELGDIEDNKNKEKMECCHLDWYEQQVLVEGFCRKYSDIDCDHGLWEQVVFNCFGCYLGRDELKFVDDFHASFYGNIGSKEYGIYSWKIQIIIDDEELYKNNTSNAVLIGLMDVADWKIKHGIKELELKGNDIITIQYDKNKGEIGFGINNKWYGVAFIHVLDTEYRLAVRSDLNKTIPNIKLLAHHWTSK